MTVFAVKQSSRCRQHRSAGLVAGMLVAAAASLAGGARANDTAGSARERFQEAVALFRAEAFEEALDAFREANRLNPSWKVLYNIGQSAVAAKMYGLAYESFEAYLAEGGDDVPKDRRQEVFAELDRLLRMVATIEVIAPPGSVVSVNGQRRGETPLSGKIKVSVGVPVQVRITRDGDTLLDEPRKLSRGESVRIDVTRSSPPAAEERRPAIGAETVAAPAAGAEEVDQGAGLWRIIGWSAAGVGAGALVGCAITGGMALSLNAKLKSACEGIHCAPGRQSDISRMNTLSVAATTLAVVGGAVLATGVVLLALSHRPQKETPPRVVQVVPLLFPEMGMGGLAIKGGF